MGTTTAPLTIDDFELLPQEQVENRELVDGELVDVSGNTVDHNELRGRVEARFTGWLEAGHSGEVVSEQDFDFLGNAHGPDVSYIGPDKLKLIERNKRVQRFVPDIAIEIAREDDTFSSLMHKKNRYLRAGTREVWIFTMDPFEVTIYMRDSVRLLRSGDAITSDLLPGFSISIDELFRDF